MKKHLNTFSEYIKEENDYVGQHTAPSKEDSPLYDVTLEGSYPDNIYTDRYNAVKYYTGYLDDEIDSECFNIIWSSHNKPNKLVKIYRAVPNYWNSKLNHKIKILREINRYYDKFGFFPMKNEIVHELEEKYKYLSYDDMQKQIYMDINNQIDELSKQKQKKLKINNGDWVTISRKYAKIHGEDNLKNDYYIISKTVKASQLYTDGNSIYEWGYNE